MRGLIEHTCFVVLSCGGRGRWIVIGASLWSWRVQVGELFDPLPAHWIIQLPFGQECPGSTCMFFSNSFEHLTGQKLVDSRRKPYFWITNTKCRIGDISKNFFDVNPYSTRTYDVTLKKWAFLKLDYPVKFNRAGRTIASRMQGTGSQIATVL